MTRQPKHRQTEAIARRLWSHKGGNIALITALVMIPLTFSLGMAFDYTLSRSRQDKLDGIADAAVLGAVTPSMMSQSCTTAAAQSTSLFDGQEASVPGVSGLVVTVSGCPDTASGATVSRTITVKYTANSQDVFATLLGLPSLPITGTSTATSATAPNINFYLLLDTSPSMEIAATSAGMSTLEGDTVAQSDSGTTDGCAFGCHQSDPSDLTPSSGCASHTDPATHRSTTACQFLTSSNQLIHCTGSGSYADGTTFTSSSTFPETGRDNYDLTRCVGVQLRIDLLNTATQNLMTTAAATEAIYNSTYKMALYETDVNQSNSANDLNLYQLQALTSNLTTAKNAAAGITAMEMYDNNHLVNGDSNDDMDTYLDDDVSSMNTLMPNPGNGTNNAGDTPQEVLFIVTDGLNDATPTRTYVPLDWNGTKCSAIKARGIRIAVLYTQYVPMTAPTDWYETNVVPALPTGLPPDLPSSTPVGTDPMALAAQQCASPGLYYEVSTNGDISTALATLFQEAVTTARLTH